MDHKPPPPKFDKQLAKFAREWVAAAGEGQEV